MLLSKVLTKTAQPLLKVQKTALFSQPGMNFARYFNRA